MILPSSPVRPDEDTVVLHVIQHHVALARGRLEAFAITHQLDADHEPCAAHVPDQRVFLFEVQQTVPQMPAG